MDITLHCTRCFRFKKRSPTTSGARVGLMPKRKNNLSCGSRHHAEGIKQQESQGSASCRRYKTTRIARFGTMPKVQNNKDCKVRHRTEGTEQQGLQGSASCRRYKTTRIARFGTVPKEQNHKEILIIRYCLYTHTINHPIQPSIYSRIYKGLYRTFLTFTAESKSTDTLPSHA